MGAAIRKGCLAVAIGIAGFANSSRAAYVASTDLLADVNAGSQSNPNTAASSGVWSYGYRGATGPNAFNGAGVPYTTSLYNSSTNPNGNFTKSLAGDSRIWGFAIANGVPDVAVNTTSAAITPTFGPTDTPLNAQEIFVHPGTANGLQTYTYIQWTAPATGIYSVTTLSWRLLGTAASDGIDAHVYEGNTDLINGNATLTSTTFSPSLASLTNLSMTAGQTLLFYTGCYGTNLSTNNNGADHTAFDLTITPEPASLGVLGLGTALVLARRSRAMRGGAK
jgi:hypothetical protein